MINKGCNKEGKLITIDELKNSHYLIKEIPYPTEEQIECMIQYSPSILLDFIVDQKLMTTDQVKRCLEKDMSLAQYLFPFHYLKKEIYDLILKDDVGNFVYLTEANEEILYFLLSLDSDDHPERGLILMINSEKHDQKLVDYAYSKNYKNLMHTNPEFISNEVIIDCLTNRIDSEEKYKSFYQNINLLENFKTKEDALNHFLKTKFIMEAL